MGWVVDGPGLEGSGIGGSGNGSPRLRIFTGSFGREGTAGSELRSGSGSAWGTVGGGGEDSVMGRGRGGCAAWLRPVDNYPLVLYIMPPDNNLVGTLGHINDREGHVESVKLVPGTEILVTTLWVIDWRPEPL